MCCSGSDIFLGVLAILFPPIAVWIKRGICSADSLINIALCCLGYLPGLLHAWYIISAYPETDYDALAQDGGEAGRTTVWYVTTADGTARQQQPQRHPHGAPTYGTMRAPGGGQFPGQAENGGGNYYAPKIQGGRAQGRGVGGADEGEGSSAGGPPPPSYSEAVEGDNKKQGP